MADSRIGQTLVSGHTLQHEGAPFNADGTRMYSQGTGGRGRALCSCGAQSPELASGYQRKRWHKEHKEFVRGSE